MVSTQLISKFRHTDLERRHIDEFNGLCRGLIADGEVNSMEAEYLLNWLSTVQNEDTGVFLVNIFDRLMEMSKDGNFDNDERAELLLTLKKCSGGHTELGESLKSSTLPIDIPEPNLEFENASYVLTGNFVFDRRKNIELKILGLGGKIQSAISSKTNFLIVAEYASENWIHSTYGRKIQAALDLKKSGHEIYICCERHLKNTLENL